MKKLTLFIWLLFIFIMSSYNSEISSNLSMGVVDLLNLSTRYHIYIRKLAHAFEFFILGILIFRITKGNIFSIVIPVVFAFLDEIHQFYVPGRTMNIMDVLIDSTGVVSAYFLYKMYSFVYRKEIITS